MVLRKRALHGDVSRGFGDVSAIDVRMSEFLSAVSTSVPVDMARVNMTGGKTFLAEYCRASVPTAHPPERLYFPPSNVQSHVSDDVHVAEPTHDSPDPQSFSKAMNSTDAPQ